MLTLIRSRRFETWLRDLADKKARARILARLTAAAQGHFGDCKALGDGLSEMRVHVGAGYRLYFVRTGATVYVMLAGGDKSTQSRDIVAAKAMARELGARDDEG
jgi:putative addiction module killer protein